MSVANDNETSELARMQQLYERTMGYFPFHLIEKFTVRVFDGMDGIWCDVVSNVDAATALRQWCDATKNGTQHTKFQEIDYYKIFPADTQMLYSGGLTMFRDDDE